MEALLLVETTGALSAGFMTILRILAKQARLPGTTDLTQYGEGRASPKAFLTHHVANISTAVQAATFAAFVAVHVPQGAADTQWRIRGVDRESRHGVKAADE